MINKIEETGIEEETEKLEAIEIAISLGAGIEYLDDDRGDGLTNKELLEYHAKGIRRAGGIVQRDILPGEEDDRIMSAEFEKVFEAQIEKAEKKGKKTNADALSRAATASALRAAAKIIVDRLASRFQSQMSTDGSPLEKVVSAYADQRLKQHNISPDVVFQRTGKLAKGIRDGKYNLFFDSSKVGQIKDAIENR